MSNETNSRYTGLEKALHANTAPYPHSRLAPSIDLVGLAQQIDMADQLINSHTNARIKVIADQIRNLQEEARRILQQAQRDQDLHRATCNFKRQPGETYFLYEKGGGSRYFSMLSPQEWGTSPHRYVGAFRLENDQSWTVIENDSSDDLEGKSHHT